MVLREVFDQPWRMATGFVGVVGIIVATFLLLRPSSDMRTLGMPPWEIFRWIDEHGEFRNTPAFALLALPFLMLARTRRQRVWTVFWLGLFVAVTEFCQLAIKTRWFDLKDIAYGWLGICASWAVIEGFAWYQKRGDDRKRAAARALAAASRHS